MNLDKKLKIFQFMKMSYNHTKDVIESLNSLKSLVSHPKLYMIHYLNELKRQIDMAYANKPLEKNTWLEMINLIDLFEIECFKNFSKKLNRQILCYS